MEKLNKLISLCKAGISIYINEYKNDYTDVKAYLEHRFERDHEEKAEIGQEIINKIIETNTVIELVFYPDTPIGFYSFIGYDLNILIDQALKCIMEDRGII